jgi:hypothetical protein
MFKKNLIYFGQIFHIVALQHLSPSTQATTKGAQTSTGVLKAH